MTGRLAQAFCLLAAGATLASAAPSRPAERRAMPSYRHIFVLVEENKGYRQLMDHPDWTPVIHRLAREYGSATQFYAEVHSSEGNYLAMVGGDTFGIHDDDAFYCKRMMKDQFCPDSGKPAYADHDVAARSLMDQLADKGLTWKAYMEDIPAPGSLVPRWPIPGYSPRGLPSEMYAAKHNAFVSFRSVNREPYPELARHLVGFAQLDHDLAADTMPNYAHIVPNQCNEMHGSDRPDAPSGCREDLDDMLVIKRGDAEIGVLVDKIMRSKVWSDPGNSAIVVTFDENNKAERASGVQGCCGYDPRSLANFGGGHIVTIVITNHGPRHVEDPTPYNHYSLLRTTEAAFGIYGYLGHAADSPKGVVTMTPLFASGR
jgi:phosphatidylinositol-3-phosphatase